MAELPLRGTRGQGKVALVDERDLPLLSQHRWYLSPGGYARTFVSLEGSKRRMARTLHQLLRDDKGGLYKDHINGDKLDNRRANLRACTQRENAYNRRIHRNNTTGHKGVSKWKGKFRATIHQDGKQIYLGLFSTAELAAAAYNGAALVLYREFARLNDLSAVEVADAAD